MPAPDPAASHSAAPDPADAGPAGARQGGPETSGPEFSGPTPEPLASPAVERPAGPWLRMLARVFDLVIVAGAGVILWSAVGMVVDGVAGASLTDYDVATAVVLAVALTAYFVWFEYAEGQTMGKQLLRLRTCGPGGGGPSLRQAAARNGFVVVLSSAAIVAALVPVAGWAVASVAGVCVAVYAAVIGVTIASSPTRQGVHDRIAGGTGVVRYPKR